MKLADLQDVCEEAEKTIYMLPKTLHHGEHQGAKAEKAEVECKLALADMTVLKAELKDHIRALTCILEVCTAVIGIPGSSLSYSLDR